MCAQNFGIVASQGSGVSSENHLRMPRRQMSTQKLDITLDMILKYIDLTTKTHTWGGPSMP